MESIVTGNFEAIHTLWNECIAVLTFQGGMNTNLVLIGTSLLGIAGGVIGTMSILRKRALMADTIAHCTLPGLALGFLFGPLIGMGDKNLPLLLIGASITGLVGALVVQWIVNHSRLQEDTAIGATLSSFFGLGIVLISIIQAQEAVESGGLNQFIFGQTASLNYDDARLLLLITGIVTLGALLPLKEMRLLCFDEGFARSNGWPVAWLDLYIMVLLVLVTVAGLHAVGVLLIVSLLIIPPAAARYWTDRLSIMITVSALIGGCSGFIGSALSALLPRLPAGAVITLTAGAFFLLSLTFAPKRGLLAMLLTQAKLRLRIVRDHVLREAIEPNMGERNDIASLEGVLILYKSISVSNDWSLPYRMMISILITFSGLSQFDRDGIRLTKKGLSLARERVRSHQLWEAYLSEHAELPESHLDLSADYVEHFISSDILSKLEKNLEEPAMPEGKKQTQREEV